MSAARYFLGLDVSTTASKALVIDETGTVIAVSSQPHALLTPRPLWSEQDPAEWWRASTAAIRDVLRTVPAESIAAVGLTGQMHGLTTLDHDNTPIRPAILWNDQRSAPQCAAITARIGTLALFQAIGSMMLPGFTAPKLLWLREHEPENYARIAHVLLPKDYVRFKLSGAFASDVADASGTGLLNIERRAWSAMMLAALDIPHDWLPTLYESTDIAAHIDSAGAAETGLAIGTPIIAGAGDQPAGAIGSGIVAAGRTSLTIGTSGVAFAAADHYAPEPHGRLHTFCHAIPDTWYAMGVMLSAAGSLRWLHDELAPGKSYDELSALAAQVPPGAEGLLFLPYLSGERHPHPDPEARGAFIGLTLRHGLPHMTRAVMEGVAFGMRSLTELLQGQAAPMTDAVVSGGAVNSPAWRQLLTDIIGVPLYTVNTTEGAAFGAAIVGAVGVGAFPDVATACAQMIRRVDESNPIAANVAFYDRLYTQYKAQYPLLKDTFHALGAL